MWLRYRQNETKLEAKISTYSCDKHKWDESHYWKLCVFLWPARIPVTSINETKANIENAHVPVTMCHASKKLLTSPKMRKIKTQIHARKSRVKCWPKIVKNENCWIDARFRLEIAGPKNYLHLQKLRKNSRPQFAPEIHVENAGPKWWKMKIAKLMQDFTWKLQAQNLTWKLQAQNRGKIVRMLKKGLNRSQKFNDLLNCAKSKWTVRPKSYPWVVVEVYRAKKPDL